MRIRRRGAAACSPKARWCSCRGGATGTVCPSCPTTWCGRVTGCARISNWLSWTRVPRRTGASSSAQDRICRLAVSVRAVRTPRAPVSRRRCAISAPVSETWRCSAAVISKGWRPPKSAWAGPRGRARWSCGSRCSGFGVTTRRPTRRGRPHRLTALIRRDNARPRIRRAARFIVQNSGCRTQRGSAAASAANASMASQSPAATLSLGATQLPPAQSTFDRPR